MRFVIDDPVGSASVFVSNETMSSQAALIAEPLARAGRPTREQAEARHAALLDRALDHFLERGFEQATIEAIAADVSMTKRTVYARHRDKAALFLAAMRRGIEAFAVSGERIAQTRVEDLEQTLINIARLRIDLVRSPHGMKLQRIINTESYRFPSIFTTYFDVATRPTVRFLADLFQAETEAGRLAIEEPWMAANAFLSMVVSGPVRIITSGNPLGEADLDHGLDFTVKLFLQGARPRPAS